MSAAVASVRTVIERWNRGQVLALAPDPSSRKAAQGISSPGEWSGVGVTAGAVWGEYAGGGSTPYRAYVDLSGPVYRCGCSREKSPCEHALGLLLLWSAGGVPPAAEPAGWVTERLGPRRAPAQRAERRAEPVPPAARRPAGRREGRVAAGLAELERWLADEIRQGLAGARSPGHRDDLARRLVDAQAPGVAGTVSRLGAVLAADDWPARLLGEYALLHLLAVAHRRLSHARGPGSHARDSGEALLQTVRARVGFPVAKEEVLAGPVVRDVWDVLGGRDDEHDRLVARRVWLRGRATGRAALLLSYAPAGREQDASPATGTTLDADLAFYPGSAPLRALVAARHDTNPANPAGPAGALGPEAGPPPGTTPRGALAEVARTLAADPWLDSWPVVLTGVVPAGDGFRLLSDPGGGLALHPSCGTPWRLVAASGGRPLTVAAEWTPEGLRPLSAWDGEGGVIAL
ncbi:hypothetical protein GCM10017673_06210 [Streptosporangium violaceochromogenes]|nr:hypothetical protein GCM10017673_06210 [Streptosporangium violaceochromogenes]